MADQAPHGEAAHSGDKALHCVVVTPERAVLDEPADFIALPMYDGELGVLPGRAPLIGRLGFGELRVRQGSQVQHYYVDGGFAQVHDNVVTLLTSKAVPAAELSAQTAQEALQQALAPATGDAVDAQLRQQERARAQLRLAKHKSEDSSGH